MGFICSTTEKFTMMKKNPVSQLAPPARVFHGVVIGFVVAMLMVGGLSKAQDVDYRTTFSDAEYYFLFQDHREALPLYLKLYDGNQTNANLQYRIGICYFNIAGLKHQAIPYLEAASKNINPSYQEGSYREQGAPTNAIFYLGEAYRVNGMLDEAIKAYNTFRSQLDTKDVYNLDYVNQQIRACELAKIMMSSPRKVRVEKLNLLDNNKYLYNPVVSYDGNSMIFTVQEKFYDAIYWIKREGDSWGAPINITLDLGIEGEVYTTSLNKDGSELFLYKNDKGVGNIYSAKLNGGKWQKAQKLGKNINTRYWETHACISADGQSLFFASSRKGGIGGLDIYESKLMSNGDWGPAINLGPTINTPHNEESPFISSDGKRLYFSSQGHNSMGGYDIFYSQAAGESLWSSPINMGFPINTPDDELYYFPVDDKVGVMAFIEKGNPNTRTINFISTIADDEVVEILIVGDMVLADNCEIQGDRFAVKLFDANTNNLIGEAKPEDVTGKFRLTAKPGNYKISIEGQGYTHAFSSVIIPNDFGQQEFPLAMKLVPEKVTSGELLIIRSILFDFDNSELNREAIFEVEKVFNILQKYPKLTIEVAGHTDSKGSAAYNQKLSLRRAQSVVNYLIEKGIEKDRLVTRAASVFENVASNYNPDGTDNPEGRSLNRRACVSVIGSDQIVKIEEDVSIPEHLKPREQNYTILLAPANTLADQKAIKDLKVKSKLESQKLTGANKQFAHIVGSFSHKSQAIELLNYCIDNGFPKATIIGEDDLNKNLSIPQVVASKAQQDDARIYTLQLYANPDPVDDYSMFKGVAVKEVKGKDGMFRYIYGEFKGKNSALQELEKIKSLGFTDAFVMNINRYKE